MEILKRLFSGRAVLNTVFRITLVLTLICIPFWYHYEPVWIDGISMEPTYDDGQWTLMQRTRSLGEDWVPNRFDVIAVWSDKHEVLLCKRIIGLPGETVEVKEGRIYLDGRELSDSFGRGKMIYMVIEDPNSGEVWWRSYDNIPPVVINQDEVWVVGDNREESVFGHFPINKIRGKIVLY